MKPYSQFLGELYAPKLQPKNDAALVEYRTGSKKFAFWRSTLGLFACLFLVTISAHSQSSQSTCNTNAMATTATSGFLQVVPATGDTSSVIQLCSIYLAVTQTATPANFQLLACPTSACSTSVPLTPVMTGHASFLDTYNKIDPTMLNVPRGMGVYLSLSAAVTNATVQVIYGVR